MTTAADRDRLPLPALAAFATPGVALGALAVALRVYLPRYYAGHLGLGLAAVGATFMAVRLIDIGVDPMIGLLMDRTRTRLGRYRVWMAAGVPVLALAVFMLFERKTSVGYPYLLIWVLVFYAGLSVLAVSHAAWASVVAARYHERSRVFGVLQLVGILGASAVLVLPSVLVSRADKSGAAAVGVMGWFVIAAVPTGVLLAWLSAPEKVVSDHHHQRFGLKDYWRMVSRPDMRRIIAADLCLALGPGWMSSLYLFYFQDARGFAFKTASVLLLIYILAGVCGAAGLARLAMRLGKHQTMRLAASGYSVGLLLLLALPKGAFAPAAVLMFALGFLAAAFPLLDRAMVADVSDAVRLEQGKSQMGLLFSMITTTQKVAGALSIGLSYVLLGLVGYTAREGAANSAAAIRGLEWIYLVVPVVCVMLGGACYIGYKLDSKRHGEIRAALDALDAAVVPAAGMTAAAAAPLAEAG
ncbi:MAG TPA: MFS transporter [Caulobacteraceae bacterium]|nr:MFS transporter [Caulobacteraceae bacterium]